MVQCISQLLIALIVVASTIRVLPCACDAAAGTERVAEEGTPSCCPSEEDRPEEHGSDDCPHCLSGQCGTLADATGTTLEQAVVAPLATPPMLAPPIRVVRTRPPTAAAPRVMREPPPPRPQPPAATDPPTLQVFRC